MTMSRHQHSTQDLQGRMNELKTLRDQIRLDLHLAGMDLRDEWKTIERKLPDPGPAYDQIKEASGDALDALADELRRFGARLRQNGAGRAASLMTPAPAICGPADSLAQALTTMWSHDVGCLPVVDEGGRVLGMVTDRDAAIAACTRGQRMDDISVQSVMSTKVVACAPTEPQDGVLALMRARQLRRVPVVAEDGRLVGILTVTDLARAIGSGADSRHPETTARDIVSTLLAIAEPAASGIANVN
jgi:CBS domain-containing protein